MKPRYTTFSAITPAASSGFSRALAPLLAMLFLTGLLHGADRPPNVVFFLVDDMGWMDSTPYGSQYYETPNMERLAARSMRFTNAYSCPLCSPTRASILTGQTSARHGITTASGHQPPQEPGHAFLPAKASPNRPIILPESKNYLEPSQFTLAEALKSRAYRTAHLGKWHLGLTEPHWPDQQGFDVAFHGKPDPGPGSYFAPYSFRKFQSFPDGPPGEYITDRLTDEAVKFLQENAHQPFYLNLWHYGVHGPWGHKEAYTAEFAKKKDPRGLQGNPIMASMLKSIDESLGRLLDTLDELKLAENTIFIFTSDNGGNVHSNTGEDAKAAKRADSPQMADWRKWAGTQPPTNNTPLKSGKGSLYEGGTRVPLMVSWPGVIPPGSQSDEVVGAIDYYPTLLELTGTPKAPEQKFDGISFAPVLKQTGKLDRPGYFTFFPHGGPSRPGGVSVRAGEWKLIRWFETGPEFPELRELYRLNEDLSEEKNLAKAMPDKVQELDTMLDGFLKDSGTLLPIPNPAYKSAPATPAAASQTPPDPTQGWVARGCQAVIEKGALKITPEGRAPFLGMAQVKHEGQAVLAFRVKSTQGGEGHIQWRTSEQETFPEEGQVASYRLNASDDWQEIKTPLKIEGRLVHFRLYVPKTGEGVEFQSIQFLSSPEGKPLKEWKFTVSP